MKIQRHRILFLSIFTLLHIITLIGQELEPKHQPELGINVSMRIGTNYHFDYPRFFLRCVEGCLSVDQKPGIGYGFHGDFVYSILKNSNFILNLGFTKHNFTDSSLDYFSGQIPIEDLYQFETKVSLNYINLGFGYGVNIKKLYLENIFIIDLVTNKYSSIRSPAFSHQIEFRFQVFGDERIRIGIGPYFKTAISDYHIFNDNYIPFSTGI